MSSQLKDDEQMNGRLCPGTDIRVIIPRLQMESLRPKRPTGWVLARKELDSVTPGLAATPQPRLGTKPTLPWSWWKTGRVWAVHTAKQLTGVAPRGRGGGRSWQRGRLA